MNVTAASVGKRCTFHRDDLRNGLWEYPVDETTPAFQVINSQVWNGLIV